jgi:hypothetical protein
MVSPWLRRRQRKRASLASPDAPTSADVAPSLGRSLAAATDVFGGLMFDAAWKASRFHARQSFGDGS